MTSVSQAGDVVMNKSDIQIGVIGTGGMGGRHAHNLAHQTVGARVSAVMDIDQARAAAVAAECGGAQAYTDATALIADDNIEAVVVASPDPTHADLSIACIEAGKPVLCEKPLATTSTDAERVMAAELAAGRRFVQVGFMREYDPAHKQVKTLIDSGDIGRPLVFRGIHNNLGTRGARLTTDVITNSAIHDIHSARWLFGSEISSVYVQRVVADPARPETCRFLIIQLSFENGGLGLIEVNADSGYGYEVLVEISGERGSTRSASLTSPSVRQSGTRSQAVDADWLARFNRAYLDEVQAWIHALNFDSTPTGPTTWDGYMSLVVAEACIRSAETGMSHDVPKLERQALY